MWAWGLLCYFYFCCREPGRGPVGDEPESIHAVRIIFCEQNVDLLFVVFLGLFVFGWSGFSCAKIAFSSEGGNRSFSFFSDSGQFSTRKKFRRHRDHGALDSQALFDRISSRGDLGGGLEMKLVQVLRALRESLRLNFSYLRRLEQRTKSMVEKYPDIICPEEFDEVLDLEPTPL